MCFQEPEGIAASDAGMLARIAREKHAGIQFLSQCEQAHHVPHPNLSGFIDPDQSTTELIVQFIVTKQIFQRLGLGKTFIPLRPTGSSGRRRTGEHLNAGLCFDLSGGFFDCRRFARPGIAPDDHDPIPWTTAHD